MLFYCAHALLESYSRSPQRACAHLQPGTALLVTLSRADAYLVSCLEHLEHLPTGVGLPAAPAPAHSGRTTGPRKGGLALLAWASVFTPIEALLGTLSAARDQHSRERFNKSAVPCLRAPERRTSISLTRADVLRSGSGA